MSDAELRRHAWAFGSAAAAYERTRPTYPRTAIQWVLAGATGDVRRVADLGAGTGKLTAVLRDVGVEAVAIDPSAPMLAVLGVSLPDARRVRGTAEELPVRSGAVDAVVCGQAWHWFDPSRVNSEVGRILRGGGVTGMLWNMRDERVAWVAALGDAMENHDDTVAVMRPDTEPPSLAPFFEATERRLFEHTQQIAPGDLAQLAFSRSHVLTRSPDDRDRILAQVERLAVTHPQLSDRRSVELPYLTLAWRAHRCAGSAT
jgi:SAM-dependent methyltransferase